MNEKQRKAHDELLDAAAFAQTLRPFVDANDQDGQEFTDAWTVARKVAREAAKRYVEAMGS